MAKKNSFGISGVDDVYRDGKLLRFAWWNIARELRTCTVMCMTSFHPPSKKILFRFGTRAREQS